MQVLINILKAPVFLVCGLLYLVSKMLMGFNILMLYSIGEAIDDWFTEDE